MTKQVKVKNVLIGGGAPVSIQSMTTTSTRNVQATLKEIEALANVGADLVRLSVPDEESVSALKSIISATETPIIADIHYDYKLALGAIEAGAHKIRINPSNLGKNGVKEVAKLAKERNIPIRVGVNAGSVSGKKDAKSLAALAMDSARLLEDEGVRDIVLAVKCSDVRLTVEAYRELHKITDYPLHVGLTEAGTANYGAIKSSVAIGALLVDGIGDTVRVSLSGNPVKEVIAARKILKSLGLINGAEVIACPTCARTQIPVAELAEKIEEATSSIKDNIKIAVMGCPVNGIEEGKSADVGVCGGKDKSMLFMNGKAYKTIENTQIQDELMKMIEVYRGK